MGSAHGPAPHRGAGGLSELQAGVARWGHLPATQSSPERVEERGRPLDVAVAAWEVMSVFPWWAVRRQLVTTVLLMTEQRLTP